MTSSVLFRATLFMLFIFLLVSGMMYAQSLLVPLFFGSMLSLLVLPISNKFESWFKNRVLAILSTLFIFIITILFVSYFIYTQISNIISNYDFIESRLLIQTNILQGFINDYTGINEGEQAAWFETESKKILQSTFVQIKGLLVGLGNFLFGLSLTFIYTFFILMYRSKIKQFILSLFDATNHNTISIIIDNIKKLVLHYLTGLLIAISIIGTMNAIGLKILGIEHGIFLGLLAGFLNIIPYIGSFIGAGLPIIMAIIYKDSMWYPIGVLAIFLFNQFIDNNITTPKIVGGYVQLNSLATIFAVIIGGMIWGVAGMILFIPLLGIFKIICDNIESLKPLSILLSDE